MLLKDKTYKQLIQVALKTRELAYVPYSNFKVGAALLTFDDKIISGCNIESAAYSPSNCAERTAFFKAVSEGINEFKAIAIVGGFDDALQSCYPCGVCRQVMAEFCNPNSFEIIVAKSIDNYKIHLLDELMPFSFGPSNLGK